MNKKRYVKALIATFVVIYAMDFMVHGVILASWYERTAVLWRAPDTMHMWIMFISQLLFAVVFVYIFTTNYENKGLAEGVRYGSYIGALLATIDLGTYCYLPVPFVLTLAWIVASFVKCVLGGLAACAAYRK